MNAGTRPARLLLTFSPGGVDGFFAELGPLMAGDQPPDPETFAPVSAKYQIEVVGPPLADLP